MSPQRRIFRKRFNIKHVKDSSAEEVIVKSIEDVGLTDNVSTTNVDKADIFALFEVFSEITSSNRFHNARQKHTPVQNVVCFHSGRKDIDQVVLTSHHLTQVHGGVMSCDM